MYLFDRFTTFYLLVVVGIVLESSVVVGQDDFWDETSCDSIGVTKNNINLNCVEFCAPFQATNIFEGLNITDNGDVYQELKCQCPDSTGCFDQLLVYDQSRPVPTCDSLGITLITDCTVLCTDLNMNVAVGGFRDANGKTECRCTGADICTDDPNCEQLRIYPGSAEQDCTEFCGIEGGVGGTPVATDSVAFAGPDAVGNKDQTFLRVSCKCGAFDQCQQSILFSDLADMEGCRDDLGIISSDSCSEYCDSFGFPDSEYMSLGLARNCTCSNEDGTTLACADGPDTGSSQDTAPSSDTATNGDENFQILKSGAPLTVTHHALSMPIIIGTASFLLFGTI